MLVVAVIGIDGAGKTTTARAVVPRPADEVTSDLVRAVRARREGY